MAKRQRDDFDLSFFDQGARHCQPLVRTRQFGASQLAHLVQVRLNQVKAMLESDGKRRPGRIEEEFCPKLSRDCRRSRIEIVGHAGRQAAAADDEFRRRNGGRQRGEAPAPFRFAQRASRQDEAVLRTRMQFRDVEVFARLRFGFDDAGLDPFVVDQAAKQLSGETSCGKDGFDIAAEPFDDPRDVDAAAAGIAPRRRTAQLERRDDAIDRGR